MRYHSVTSLVCSFAILTLAGCACPQYSNFFPRLRPLFPGFDETKVRPDAKPALDEAKVDFQLARQGKAPRYARYEGTRPHNESKIYQGQGYRITVVNNWAFHSHSEGVEIVMDASITGGKPFSYDEVDRVVD
jgi:hypothetical protein